MADAMFREQLTALGERLSAYDRGEPAVVLDSGAVALADQLAAAVAPDDQAAVETRVMLALFWWYRFWALPPGRNLVDLRTAAGRIADLDNPARRRLPAGLATLLEADPELAGAPADWAGSAMAILAIDPARRELLKIDRSIDLICIAAQATEVGSEARAVFLANQAVVRGVKYDHTGQSADRDAAIDAARAGVDALGPNYPGAAFLYGNLALWLRTRYGDTGSAVDLDDAIEAGREAARRESPHRAVFLSGLGIALRLRFRRSPDQTDLDEAIDAGRAAASAMAINDPDRIVTLTNLAQALEARATHVGSDADLDEAVQAGRAATAELVHGHNIVQALTTLAGSLFLRFQRAGTVADLDEARDAIRTALRLTAEDNPERTSSEETLCQVHWVRYGRLGEIDDLNEVVDLRRKLLAATAGDASELSQRQCDLAIGLSARFNATGMRTDLTDAVLLFAQALSADPAVPPGEHPQLRMPVSRLAEYARTGDVAGLADPALAAELGRLVKAAIGTSRDLTVLCVTGWLYWLRYLASPERLYGPTADLVSARSALRQVYLAAPLAVPGPMAAGYSKADDAAISSEQLLSRQLDARGLLFLDRYNASGHLDLLRGSVRLLQQAAAAVGEPAEWVAIVNNNLGLALSTLGSVTKERETMEGAVAAFRLAVSSSVSQDHYLPGRLSALSGALEMMSASTDDPAVLDEAIEVGRTAVALAPEQHPSLGRYLANLASAILERYDRTGSDQDLQEVVRVSRLAASAPAPDSLHRAERLRSLGVALLRLSEKAGEPTLLTESIQVQREALELAPRGPIRWRIADSLRASLEALYEHTNQLELLDEAITLAREALTNSSIRDQEWDRTTNVLVKNLRQLHARTGDRAALREAVDVLRDHTANLTPENPKRSDYLALLAVMLPDLLGVADDHALLEEAVVALRTAVTLTAPGSQQRARHTGLLADALVRQFEHTGNAAALREAVQAAREAAEATAPDEARWGLRFGVLVMALAKWHEITGETADMEDTIRWAESVATEAGADGRIALAELLYVHGKSIGELAEIEKAVRIIRDVMAQPDFGGLSSVKDFGQMLMQVYLFTGASEVVREAVDVLRRTIEALLADGSEPWILRNDLASALGLLYDRTGDEAVLREAVEITRIAAAEIPSAYPYRSVYLGNLADRLSELARVTGDASLLEEAVDAARAAVLATAAAPAFRPVRLTGLSQVLLALFKLGGDAQTLREAINTSRDAVRDSPESDPRRVHHLAILGDALLRQHRHDGDMNALRGASEVLSEAARLSTGTVQDRIKAGMMWGSAAMLQADATQALQAYEHTIDLVLQRVGPSLARSDREYGLQESAGLPSDAAAAAIAAGNPGRAVELLEHGRGVLLGEALHFRTDMSGLEADAPDLADEFRRIGQELDAIHRLPANHGLPAYVGTAGSGVPIELSSPAARTAERRAALADEFARLAERIRTVPGFADFMRSPSLSAVQAEMGPGPVAIINASRWRCDALLVTPDGVDVLPLPELSLTAATERVNEYLVSVQEHEHAQQAVLLLQQIAAGDRTPSTIRPYQTAKVALHRQAEAMETTLRTTLAWLWDVIANPVLEHLGYTAVPTRHSPWPRIWWCPTGPLTLLPLHAAGHHGREAAVSDRAVIERVVSSYAPSLRALIEARRVPADRQVGEARILITAMPATAGQAPLPNVAHERDLLRRLLPAHRSTVLEGPAATREAVLSSLPQHRWAHFSCHGDQDLGEPSRGGLLLADGILTITDIGARHYQAEFAFLSACKTATGGVTLMDEAITLAAALQYAGYRHIVATSWSVYDTSAARVTEEMYGRLIENGLLYAARTASVLHRAIRLLRRQYLDHPSVWMPFTHLGP
jgi:tetratricopeptide (TPR) repeat protein